MNTIVDNLLRKPDKPTTWLVLKPVGDTRYQVLDSSGRKTTVEADTTWIPGAFVTVVSGRITGSAKKFINPKIYEV